MKQRPPMRNTRTERICRACDGAGEHTRNRDPSGDPQQEYPERCTFCCGDGWIRWAPRDPLEVLAAERRQRLALKQGNDDERLRYSAAAFYRRARLLAMLPVRLP